MNGTKVGIGLALLALLVGGVWLWARPEAEQNGAQSAQTQEQDSEQARKEVVQRLELDPAKYSFDLSGAERIVVQYDDASSGKPLPFEQKTISDEAQVREVIEILSELPTEGDLELETSPGLVTTIAGFRGGELVGYVEFHRTLLRAENGNYYADVPNEVGQRESRLYSIVAELR